MIYLLENMAFILGARSFLLKYSPSFCVVIRFQIMYLLNRDIVSVYVHIKPIHKSFVYILQQTSKYPEGNIVFKYWYPSLVGAAKLDSNAF